MAGLSKYEKIVLLLTVGFVLFTGLWFWNQERIRDEYQITVHQREPAAGGDLSVETEASGSGEPAEEEPDSLLPGEQININTADAFELQRLPGIGEKRAQDIIAYREEHGPFETVEELDHVSGIGPGILEGLLEYACTGS